MGFNGYGGVVNGLGAPSLRGLGLRALGLKGLECSGVGLGSGFTV